MNALPYLFLTKIKNRIREFFRKPAQIIYLVVILAMFVFVIFTGNQEVPSSGGDPKNLTAILTAYFMLMFVLIAKNGFNRGGAIFSLPDVNLIFTAPFKPSRVLFYGLFGQLGTSLLLGLVLIAQYAWMNLNFGVTATHMVVLILGYAVLMFAAQLFAMLVYSFTSGREKLRQTLKWVFYGIIVVYIAGVLFYVISGADLNALDLNTLLARAAEAMNTLPAKLFPFSGWFGGIFFDIYTGERGFLWIGLLLFALYVIGSVFAIIFFKHDYYEDVLKTAEYNYSAIVAKKEGKTQEALPENIKVGKTGFSKGEGASAFYYKHLIENRRSKRLLISPMEFVFALITFAFAYFMGRMMISEGSESFWAFFVGLVFGAYMQVFTAALGRLPKELSKPYIYLVPEPPFKKLFNAIRDGFPGIIFEAVLIFLPLGMLLHAEPLDILLAIAARISYSFLFIALNILSQRIFGEGRSAAFTMIFYILLLLVMAAPGIVLSVVVASLGAFVGFSAAFLPLLLMAGCNFAVALLVIFLCRNMLQQAEWNN